MPGSIIEVETDRGVVRFSRNGEIHDFDKGMTAEDAILAQREAVKSGRIPWPPSYGRRRKRRTKVEITADKVKDLARSLWPGADIDTYQSLNSEAVYITVGDEETSVTVRVARHATGSHFKELGLYGEPNVDIGPHNEGVTGRAALSMFTTFEAAEERLRTLFTDGI